MPSRARNKRTGGVWARNAEVSNHVWYNTHSDCYRTGIGTPVRMKVGDRALIHGKEWEIQEASNGGSCISVMLDNPKITGKINHMVPHRLINVNLEERQREWKKYRLDRTVKKEKEKT